MMEAKVISTATGSYRWERDEGWQEEFVFEEGDFIVIDPFSHDDPDNKSRWTWPIFGEFVEYVTDDIAKIYVPEKSGNSQASWFPWGEGEYVIHEGYLTPQ